MKTIPTLISLVALTISIPAHAGGKDDPVLGKLMIDQFEKRYTEGT